MWGVYRFDRVTAKIGGTIDGVPPVPTATRSCLGVIGRATLMVPVGALGIALTATLVGAPLGIPLLLWAGHWIAAPIQQHPNFRIPTPKEQALRAALADRSSSDQYLGDSDGYQSVAEWMEGQ